MKWLKWRKFAKHCLTTSLIALYYLSGFIWFGKSLEILPLLQIWTISVNNITRQCRYNEAALIIKGNLVYIYMYMYVHKIRTNHARSYTGNQQGACIRAQ